MTCGIGLDFVALASVFAYTTVLILEYFTKERWVKFKILAFNAPVWMLF